MSENNGKEKGFKVQIEVTQDNNVKMSSTSKNLAEINLVMLKCIVRSWIDEAFEERDKEIQERAKRRIVIP